MVKEFLRYLPDYQIIYFGDSARLPYGTKSPRFIRQCSKEIVKFLLKKGAKVIVIACHTASALAADFLRREFKDTPIFEIITPGVSGAIQSTKNKTIGIIGTPGTVNSGVHRRALLKKVADLNVYTESCPLLVPLIEEGWFERKETRLIVKNYLAPLKKKKIDTLILACTHYPLLKKVISFAMGKRVRIINPAKDLALSFRSLLRQNEKLANSLKKSKQHQFFLSDDPYNFRLMSRFCLGKEINPKIVRFN